jgi:CheY-like chemotaxis protein
MNLNILIIEDDKGYQERIKMIMDTLCYHFDLATYGEEAIEKLEEKKYDIVITDKRMKFSLSDIGEDNEAGMKILDYVVKKNIPCYKLVITAYGDVESTRKAFKDYHVYDYVEKDSKFKNSFINALNEILNKNVKYDKIKLDGSEVLEGEILTGYFEFSGMNFSKKKIHRRELEVIEFVSNISSSNNIRFIKYKITLTNNITYKVNCFNENIKIKLKDKVCNIKMRKIKKIEFAQT